MLKRNCLSLFSILILFVTANALASGKKPKADVMPVTTLTPLPAGQTWIDEPMSQWMERAVRRNVTDKNKVVFLENGTEFLPVRLRIIRDAKPGDTIDISTFLWCDDPAGLLIAEELAMASHRGVRVRAIVDYINNFNGPHSQVYATLRNAGIPLIEFNPPYWGLDSINSTRTHEKLMVWNGGIALVGGANLCDEYQLGKRKKLWHDFEVYVAGPVVKQMQEGFDTTFNEMSDAEYNTRVGYEMVMQDPEHMPHVFRTIPRYSRPTPSTAGPIGDARVLYAYQQPWLHKEDSKHYIAMYSELIRRAQSRVVLYMPYVVPPKEFEDAMAEAARKGKRVIVMTNSKWSNDEGTIIAMAAFGHYRALMNAGVEFYEIEKTALHGKAMLIDDRLLVIGSHNFDNRSFLTQAENNIITGDQVAIKKFSDMVEREVAEWHRLTLKDISVAQSGAGNSILGALGHMFERFF